MCVSVCVQMSEVWLEGATPVISEDLGPSPVPSLAVCLTVRTSPTVSELKFSHLKLGLTVLVRFVVRACHSSERRQCM